MNELDGERLTSGLMARTGTGRRLSFRRNGLEGRTGTDPRRAPGIFFRLDGGIKDGGRVDGTGSFSLAAYTRSITCGGQQMMRDRFGNVSKRYSLEFNLLI